MTKNSLHGAVEWALMVALVLGVGAVAQAQNEAKPDGKVVKIGRADGDAAKPKLPAPEENPGDHVGPQRMQMPKYWIGLLGGAITPDNPLRAHLDLPENAGLIVANIVPESPAAKAGLKKHDILLKANDKDLHEMQDLVELVMSEGPKKGQITLEVLRHNKRETVYLTPEERPANAPMPQNDIERGPMGGGELGLPNELLERFGGNFPMEFRNFGPGVIVGGGGGVANMPNGVSVSVKKENDKPAEITVKRGNDTWTVVGDDPESLKQLPEDLRPFVEGMLRGHGGMVQTPHFDRPVPGPGFGDGRLQDRLERMEKRLEELQKRLGTGQAEKAEQQEEATK